MELIKSLILHSYDLVVQKLPKKIQLEIQQLRA
jgi:predicted DNA-binding protein (MmcQ/YjbR family)